MRGEEPASRSDEDDEPVARRVRLPGFSAETAVGLGDVIKRTTSLVGIRPCGSCRERAASLNRRVVFTGRR
jgi:hypothetical protein